MIKPCACIPMDDLECGIQFDDYIRKARKIHKCCECKREIQIGEDYKYYKGIWDDSFCTFKTCLDCETVKKVFFCDGWKFMQLWEDVWEHVCELDGKIDSECILALSENARDKLLEMIDDFWED